MYDIDDIKRYIHPRIDMGIFCTTMIFVSVTIYLWTGLFWMETLGNFIAVLLLNVIAILLVRWFISDVKRVLAGRKMLERCEQNGLLEKVVIEFRQATAFLSDKLRIGNDNIFVKHNASIYPINKVNVIYIEKCSRKGSTYYKLHLGLENGKREDLGLEWSGRGGYSEVIKVAEALHQKKENIKTVLVEGSKELELEIETEINAQNTKEKRKLSETILLVILIMLIYPFIIFLISIPFIEIYSVIGQVFKWLCSIKLF